jgi:hypothetical protein
MTIDYHILNWQELAQQAVVLLCNSQPDATIPADEWREALKAYLDAVHDLEQQAAS